MLDIEIGAKRDCEGFTRRDVLRIGGLSAFGLTLPNLLQAQTANPQAKIGNRKSDMSCILLWMGGGPSHIDTFDPKPDAPQEIRGSFGVLETNVKGVRISDQLPKLAKQMDKFSILRSVTSPDGTHETATHYLLTGYPFGPAAEYPGYGAVVAREKGFQNGMPPYAMFGGMPNNHGGGGYMGATYNPFIIGGDPNNPGFRVEDVAPPNGVDVARMDRRRLLRGALDDFQRDKETASKSAQTMDEFLSAGVYARHVPRRQKSLQSERRKRQTARSVRAYKLRAIVPVGAAHGGSGCPRRVHQLQRLGHAREQFQRAQKQSSPATRSGLRRAAQRPERTRGCWIPRLSSGWASLAGRPASTPRRDATTGPARSAFAWAAAA